MTEELENKLNELLGMKKQIEELYTDNKIGEYEILLKFEKQGRMSKIKYIVNVAAFLFMGVIGYFMLYNTAPSSSSQTEALIIIIGACVLFSGGEIKHHNTKNKLAILKEIKQFELRLTEMLKK